MKKFALITVLLINALVLLSQPTGVYIKIVDDRYSKENSIPMDHLLSGVQKDFASKNINSISSIQKDAFICSIRIDYLNYYQNASGNFFGKGVLNINIKTPYVTDFNVDFTVTSDILFKKMKLKNYNNPKFSYAFEEMNIEVQDQLLKRMLSKMEPFYENYAYYAGPAPVTDNETRAVSTSSSDPVYVSDVDNGIPMRDSKVDNRFALIIGNEDYTKFQNDLSSEVNVDFAVADASIFAEYCKKTLGIKEDNIVLLTDAISSQMNREIDKLSKLAQYSNGSAELIFYYAGHGFPDEITKESYIMPVDISGSDVNSGIKLSDLYKKLTQYPTVRVSVFLDACFSGGGRNQGLLAARGVRIAPKENPIPGNLIVFSASNGDQSSLPYKQKQHGMFTYFLLKKLQETKGNVSYKELGDYIRDQVQLNSIKINSKDQNPQVMASPSLSNNLENIKMN